MKFSEYYVQFSHASSKINEYHSLTEIPEKDTALAQADPTALTALQYKGLEVTPLKVISEYPAAVVTIDVPPDGFNALDV